VPPLCETAGGLAVTEMIPDAPAAPILISTPLPLLLLPEDEEEPVRAAPENALMMLVPEIPPALNVAVATPLTVGTSAGLTVPSVVVKLTTVPL